MFTDFAPVLIFLFFGMAIVVGSLVLGSFVRRTQPSQAKNSIYECGEPTIGSSWIRYNSRFYHIALVYLLFDVEIVLLIPFALVFRHQIVAGEGTVALVSFFFFMFVLIVGLIYEWFWGNLNWLNKQEKN